MKKNYLFDVDGLLQVLKAIQEGSPWSIVHWRNLIGESSTQRNMILIQKTVSIVSSLVNMVNTWEILLYLLRLCRKL